MRSLETIMRLKRRGESRIESRIEVLEEEVEIGEVGNKRGRIGPLVGDDDGFGECRVVSDVPYHNVVRYWVSDVYKKGEPGRNSQYCVT